MQLDDELVAEYLIECKEGLDRLDQDLIDLEQSEDDRAILDSIFRAFHTIKGGAGFFGFSRLESLTHAGEEVLSRLREGDMELSTDIATALLSLLDTVRDTVQSIESQRNEGTSDISEVLALMRGFLQPETVEMALPPLLVSEGDAPSTQPAASNLEVAPSKAVDEKRTEGKVNHESQPSSAPKPAVRASQLEAAEVAATTAPATDATIRVDVNLLDKLMNLVGELVLARNQILQHSSSKSDSSLKATSQRLNLITTELQEGVMKTRMQPVGNIWSRFPRVVRDLALTLGKQIQLEMQGQDTELDKTLIEALKDPMTHIVRNSVDHGIETPEERLAQGKPAEGTLSLRAYHEGGQVNIEVSDDGAGINPERVRQKALERGLIRPDEAARMSEQEIAMLVFSPGFSTASSVTNISGRGVGMDVVKTNIEKIGGVIEVVNRPGQGLTLKIKIPLTLAIIPALMVSAGEQRYAIPQANLLELLRLDLNRSGGQMEMIDQTPVYRLRGQLLPLVHLNRVLGLCGVGVGEEDSSSIVVLQAGEARFGLVVDTIKDTEEIVVKPLAQQLKQISVYAGATILGDGSAALILDVGGLARQANLSAVARRQRAEAAGAARAEDETTRLLLCRVGAGRRLALRLDDVARLEEIAEPRIERAGGNEVIVYRGDILPLVRLSRLLGEPEVPEDSQSGSLSLVVGQRGQTQVGLVVDKILDVIDAPLHLKPNRTPGVLEGAAILSGEVTEMLNLDFIVESLLDLAM